MSKETIYYDGKFVEVDEFELKELLATKDCSGRCEQCGIVSVWTDRRHYANCGDECCKGTLI